MTWSIKIFMGLNYIFEAGLRDRDLFKLREISDNISITVQDGV